MKGKNLVIISLIIAILFPLFFLNKSFIIYLLTLALIYAIGAISFNLLLGIAGQLSLGHAAFMGIGAYTSTLLVMKLNLPFLPSLIIAGIVSSLFGILIGFPSLRVTGFYLALVTMAFGIAITQIIGYLSFTGGYHGIKDIPPPEIFGLTLSSDLSKYYLALIFLIVTIILLTNLINSKTGRALKSLRENEILASSLGINVSYYKILVFVISAFFAGISGSLYAHTVSYISPNDFGLGASLNFLAMIVIGGLGSVPGSILGAIFITIVPVFFARTSFSPYVFNGIMIILIMILLPQGLIYLPNLFKKKV